MSGNKALADHILKSQSEDIPMTQIVYDTIRATEPLVTAAILKTARALEAAGHNGAHLEGTEYSVKTASNIENKLERIKEDIENNKTSNLQPFDPAKEVGEMKDILRYTIICDHKELTNATLNTQQILSQQGYTLSGVKNYYANPYEETGYQGLHLNFITPYGHDVEVQVHSRESFDAKQKGHKLFERIRTSSLSATKDKDKAEIFKIHGAVPKCPGYEKIKDYKMPEGEKQALKEAKAFTVDIELDKHEPTPSDTSRTTICKVYQNDELLLSSFEHTFRDGSMWTCTKFEKEPTPETMTTLQPDGEVIEAFKIKDVEYSLDKIKKLTEAQEKSHEIWMEKNMPHGELGERNEAIVKQGLAVNEKPAERKETAVIRDFNGRNEW